MAYFENTFNALVELQTHFVEFAAPFLLGLGVLFPQLMMGAIAFILGVLSYALVVSLLLYPLVRLERFVVRNMVMLRDIYGKN